MTSLQRAALWVALLSHVHPSFSDAISCQTYTKTQCQGTAEIHCKADRVIEKVTVTRPNTDVSCEFNTSTPDCSLDPRIRVEFPPDKPSAVVFIKNISFSDSLQYTVFAEAHYGHSEAKPISITVTGFCDLHISVSKDKQEITCTASGMDRDGQLEWSDNNQTTWNQWEANDGPMESPGEGSMVTLNRTLRLGHTLDNSYCCRVASNKTREALAKGVCLHALEVTTLPVTTGALQEEKLERNRIFLLFPLLPFTVYCVLGLTILWCNVGPAARRHRERTLSETPLVE